MNRNLIVFGVMALAALVLMSPDVFAAGTDAATAGDNFKQTLEKLSTGNLGLFIGLGVTILGLWTWIVGQKTGPGLIMVIGGVLLTVAPGVFNGARDIVDNAVSGISNSNNTTVKKVGE